MRLSRRTALGLLAAPALAETRPALRVISTGAVEDPLRALAAAFTEATGRAVALNTGNGGQVAARVRAGEAFDLVSNAAGALEGLIADGLLDGATRAELGRMRLGLAIRAGAPVPDIGTPEALRATLLAAPSIAHSDAAAGATSGRHILGLLDRLGIAGAVEARRLPFARGLSAVEAVAAGRAALVMTQISEIIVVPGAMLVGPLPESLQLVTRYGAAIPRNAADTAGGRALLAALTGPAGRARFEAAGFAVG